jgi:hypothetical protein
MVTKRPPSDLPRGPGKQALRTRVLAGLAFLIAVAVRSQELSNLEPERPIAMEDARPIAYRAFSGSADWTYNRRLDGFHDYGPGFTLSYGAARRLEVGAGVRWLTRPGRNAERGISSGDLVLHALYAITSETGSRPALALRGAVEFPTGLDSKGTDLALAGLLTRSSESFRVHANLLWRRLGAVRGRERRDRFGAIVGIDLLPRRSGLTDTILLSDLFVRTNPLRDDKAIVTLEIGAKRRIGVQTALFAAAGTDLIGEGDRNRFTVRVGFSHAY